MCLTKSVDWRIGKKTTVQHRRGTKTGNAVEGLREAGSPGEVLRRGSAERRETAVGGSSLVTVNHTDCRFTRAVCPHP